MRGWVSICWLSACLCATSLACDRGASTETPVQQVDATEAHSGAAEQPTARDRARQASAQEGLLIGEFRLAKNPVIDGDTIRVQGVDGSVRLLSLDTEERFHGKADRRAASKDFARYMQSKRGNAARPQKAGTPMGEEAAKFAEAFFEGAEVVRLERDDTKEIRGNFGRLLAYAFVKKNGRWTSYNVECVRAGMSPYFTKYGYSRRFHNQLAHAEVEAREAKRGIWDPQAQGYGDYEERKAWWDARADFIRSFEHEANRRADFILLTQWDAIDRLEKNLGKEVTVFSNVDKIDQFKGLVRVSLDMQPRKPFPVIFFDKAVFRETEIERHGREPVTIRGTVERYEKGKYRTLQIVVTEPAQVTLPALP